MNNMRWKYGVRINTITDIKREVMTHFSYHNMFDLCSDELFEKACDILKSEHIKPSFYTVSGKMKELIRGE